MPDRRSPVPFAWALLAAVAVAVVVVYRDALRAWFAADDFLWLDLSRLDSVLASFVGPWGHGAGYRPLARVSFFVDASLFGDDARLWHAESLLVHAAAATLLGVLLARLSADRLFAASAALVFALLPLGDEVVIWISGRIYSLGLALLLAALVLLDRFLLAPTPARLASCLVVAAAALLTHEPFVLVVPYAALVIAVRLRDVPARRAALAGLVGVAAIAAAYALVRRWAVGGGTFYAPRSFDAERLAADLAAVARLLLTQIGAAGWIACGALAAASVAAPRWLVAAGLGLAVAAIGFAPFAIVDNFGFRYLYVSGAGLAIAVAASVAGLARVPGIGRAAAAALLLAVLVAEARAIHPVARQWREAGDIARRTLAAVAARGDAAGDGIAVVFDVPLMHGRGMLFYTYFELALRRFHPEFLRLAIPGHAIAIPGAPFGSIAVAWRREAARRARLGLPPVPCAAADPATTRRLRRFTRALFTCDTLFLDVGEAGGVSVVDRAAAAERLATAFAPGPGGRAGAEGRPPGGRRWPWKRFREAARSAAGGAAAGAAFPRSSPP